MNTAIYAERTAHATDSMIEACQRLAGVDGFEDVAALMAAAHSKDKDAQVLLQREAFAQVMQRVAERLAPNVVADVVVTDEKKQPDDDDDDDDETDEQTDDVQSKARKPARKTRK